MATVEIGQPLGEQPEQRNPIGWLLVLGLMGLMVIGQFASSLDSRPSVSMLRARIETRLESAILLQGMGGTSPEVTSPPTDSLASSAAELRPKITGDSEATLLYAAIQTERKAKLEPSDLAILRMAKDPVEKAAYEIYSSTSLTPARAKELANLIPSTRFLYKLIAAHALEKGSLPGARGALVGANEGKTKVGAGFAEVLLLLGGIVILVAYSSARQQRLLPTQGPVLKDLSGADADRLALRAGQMFLAFLAVAYLMYKLLAPVVSRDSMDVPVYVTILIVAFLLTKVPATGKLISFRSLGMTSENLGRNILWGACAAIANLPIIAILQMASYRLLSSFPAPEHPLKVEITDTGSVAVIVQLFLASVVLGPVLEEMIFRGTLFPAMSRVLKGPVWGAVASSLLFAAIHPTGVPLWPGLAAIGCMSCYIAYQTKSLVPSITMHVLHNLITFVMTLILTR